MSSPLENSAGKPDSDENSARGQFLLVPLAGEESPFGKIKPPAAVLTLAAIRDAQTGFAKRLQKEARLVWDFREREKLAAVTGQSVRTISDHWRVLELGGWIEIRKRKNYRTAEHRLTEKSWKAFDEQASLLQVYFEVLAEKWDFGKTIVCSFILYRMQLPDNITNQPRGYCSDGSREIANQTGLERFSVQRVMKKLITENVFVQNVVRLESGKLEHRIQLAPQSSGHISAHEAGATSSQPGGHIFATWWPHIRTTPATSSHTIQTVSKSYTDLNHSGEVVFNSGNPGQNPATSSNETAQPQNHPASASILLPAEWEQFCGAVAKRSKQISFNPLHAYWFLRGSLTAAHAEISDFSALQKCGLIAPQCFGIEPFRTSLQSALVGCYERVARRVDVRKPEEWFKVVELEKRYGKPAVEFLYKSDFRKRIDMHFEKIILRIGELIANRDSQNASEAAAA
jgi:hypothetical protein